MHGICEVVGAALVFVYCINSNFLLRRDLATRVDVPLGTVPVRPSSCFIGSVIVSIGVLAEKGFRSSLLYLGGGSVIFVCPCVFLQVWWQKCSV